MLAWAARAMLAWAARGGQAALAPPEQRAGEGNKVEVARGKLLESGLPTPGSIVKLYRPRSREGFRIS